MAIRRIYGPQNGEDGSVDKYGVCSLVLPFFADSVDEAAYGALPNETSFGENLGKRRFKPWLGRDGGYLVTATFEGAVGSPNLDSDDKFFWEFDSSFAERRLESHPNIQTLITKYGGQIQDDGTIFWPVTYSPKNTSSTGLGTTSAVATKNPLFGGDSYVELQAVFRMTKLRSRPSSDLLEQIGAIKKDLPVAVATPQGRDWLIMPPRVAERGNVVTETHEWLMGPHGGWPPDIYEFIVQ